MDLDERKRPKNVPQLFDWATPAGWRAGLRPKEALRAASNCSHERPAVANQTEAIIPAMMAYDWPGNVRELENCVEQCCALNSGPTIHITDLPNSITGSQEKFVLGSPESRIAPIAVLERRAILGAIEQLNGDKLTAAKLLGIGKTTLYRKLKEYGMARSF